MTGHCSPTHVLLSHRFRPGRLLLLDRVHPRLQIFLHYSLTLALTASHPIGRKELVHRRIRACRTDRPTPLQNSRAHTPCLATIRCHQNLFCIRGEVRNARKSMYKERVLMPKQPGHNDETVYVVHRWVLFLQQCCYRGHCQRIPRRCQAVGNAPITKAISSRF